MKTKWFIPLVAAALFSCSQPEKIEKENVAFNVEGKTAVIVTTAKDTDLRLTQTGTAEFKKTAQPTEGANSVFVNLNKCSLYSGLTIE